MKIQRDTGLHIMTISDNEMKTGKVTERILHDMLIQGILNQQTVDGFQN
jgi:hypothetical protein